MLFGGAAQTKDRGNTDFCARNRTKRCKLLHIDSHLCSGGDLNPILGFCFPLFSIVLPREIAISVENSGT